jgi:hypothetical protein
MWEFGQIYVTQSKFQWRALVNNVMKLWMCAQEYKTEILQLEVIPWPQPRPTDTWFQECGRQWELRDQADKINVDRSKKERHKINEYMWAGAGGCTLCYVDIVWRATFGSNYLI